MKSFIKHSFCVLIGIFGLTVLPAEAAQQVYLQIEGIEGESTDKAHVDWIEVLAWSWGMSNSNTTHTGTGGGAEVTSVQDLSVTKYIDKATTALMLKAMNGAHIAEATLEVWEDCCETPYKMFAITMTNVLVTSVSTGGSNSESRFTENITLNFAKLRVEYTPADQSGTSEMSWDIPTNREQ